MVEREAEDPEQLRLGVVCSCQTKSAPLKQATGSLDLPIYEIVISSPSLIGSSALKNACLPVKLTAAFGMQEWLTMARDGSKKMPAWPVSASVLSKEFVWIYT